MRRVHLYAIVFGLGALGLSGTAVIVGLFAVVLPGLVLLAAPTAALYLPITDAVFTSIRRRRWLFLAASTAAGAIAFIIIPSRLNDRLAYDVAAAQKADFGSPANVRLGRIFLVAGTEFAGLGTCGVTCARLLVDKHAGQILVPLVRFDENLDLANGFQGPVAVYGLQAATVCPPLDKDDLRADREILAKIGAGACIIRTTADGAEFDTGLVSRTERHKPVEPLNPFASGVAMIERRSLWRCRAGQCEKTLHQTTVEGERLIIPLLIGLGSSGSSLIRAFSRTSFTANPHTNLSVLGLVDPEPAAHPLNPTRPRLSAAEGSTARQAALIILDATSRAPRELTAAEVVIVNHALAHLRDTPGLGEDDHRLLKAVLAREDLDGLNFANVFQLRPAIRDALAPELVQAFEQRGSFQEPSDRSEIAKEIGLLSQDEFMSLKAEILLAASRPFALYYSDELSTRLGDYGKDALPVLAKALSEGTTNYQVVLGLCRIGRDASPFADDVATLQRSPGQGQSWEERAAALALRRMGRADLIEIPRPNLGALGRSLELRAWYRGIEPITPDSPASLCSESQLRLSH